MSTLARSQLVRHDHVAASTAIDLRRSAARGLDQRAGQLMVAAHAIRASGGAELRDAHRRLADLALDAAGAARRRCVEATVDLAAAAVATERTATEALVQAGAPIERARTLLTRARVDGVIGRQSTVLAAAGRRVERDVHRALAADTDRAASRRAVLEAYDPRRQLARGWTLTHTPGGRLVRSAADVAEGDDLVTTFGDGAATSTVTGVARHDHEDAAR